MASMACAQLPQACSANCCKDLWGVGAETPQDLATMGPAATQAPTPPTAPDPQGSGPTTAATSGDSAGGMDDQEPPSEDDLAMAVELPPPPALTEKEQQAALDAQAKKAKDDAYAWEQGLIARKKHQEKKEKAKEDEEKKQAAKAAKAAARKGKQLATPPPPSSTPSKGPVQRSMRTRSVAVASLSDEVREELLGASKAVVAAAAARVMDVETAEEEAGMVAAPADGGVAGDTEGVGEGAAAPGASSGHVGPS